MYVCIMYVGMYVGMQVCMYVCSMYVRENGENWPVGSHGKFTPIIPYVVFLHHTAMILFLMVLHVHG